MVAPAEAFHWYVTEVPPVLLPFAGDKRVGAAGIAGEGVGVGACVGVGGGACVGVGLQVNEQVKETVKLSAISRLIVLLVSVQSPVFEPCIVQLTKRQHPPSIAWSTTTWASS